MTVTEPSWRDTENKGLVFYWILPVCTEETGRIVAAGQLSDYVWAVSGEIEPWADYAYEVIDGGACITAWHTGDTVVEIPAEIDGFPVTALGDGAFRDNTGLKQVKLPASLKSIGNDAFAGCGSLERPDLPLGLKSIGDRAFNGTPFRIVRLPRTLENIGEDAFPSARFITCCKGTWSETWAEQMAEQNPDIKVTSQSAFTVTHSPEVAFAGNEVTFTAENTYDSGADFAYQWQLSKDGGESWEDCEGEKKNTYSFTVSANNFWVRYRIMATDSTGTYFSDEVIAPYFGKGFCITYVQASATEIALKWDVAPEGTVYTIFMKKEGERERVLVKDLTDNFYTVSGLEPDTRYSFRIIARHGLHFLQFPILMRKTKAE